VAGLLYFNNMFFVYVLRSARDGRLYKGYCEDIEKRLAAHNGGRVRSTRGYRPWKVVYREKFATEAEAVARERFLKSGSGREYLNSLNLD
jgi:putative endonuclease